MGTTTVYLDVIFLDNLMMDFFILHLSMRLSKTETKTFRILLGAAVGAIYAVCVVLTKNHWLTNIISKLMVCVVMTAFVTTKWTLSRFFKLFGWVIVISFFCAGMLFFVMYLDPSAMNTINGTISFLNKALKMKIMGAIGSYFVLNWFFKSIYEFKKIEQKIVTVCIKTNEKEFEFNGLVDSGNQLTHPETKAPLPVINVRKIEVVSLNDKVENDYEFIKKVGEMVEQSTQPLTFFVVSYQTISQDHAVMPGIFATEVVVKKEDKILFQSDHYPIALTMNEIQSSEECGGIIPAQLIEVVA